MSNKIQKLEVGSQILSYDVISKVNEVIDFLNEERPDEEIKYGDTFWFVNSIGDTTNDSFTDSNWSKEIKKLGNFFRTEEEAEAAAIKVRELFNIFKK